MHILRKNRVAVWKWPQVSSIEIFSSKLFMGKGRGNILMATIWKIVKDSHVKSNEEFYVRITFFFHNLSQYLKFKFYIDFFGGG